MADVKWIKIVTDIFDDEKILLIESLPEADSIIVIWFKLLCLAGRQNNGGVFMMNGRIAYTDEMFATIFRRNLNTVRMAMSVFEQYGMIEIINHTVTIPNWEKHQQLDALELAREATRKRVAKHREKQRLLACGNVTDNVTGNVTDDVTVTGSNADRIDKNRLDKNRDVKGDKRPRFTPPTLSEVEDYATEKGYTSDEFSPEDFIDFYTTKGWKVGKDTMKDWKASVRLWVSRHRKEHPQKPEQTNSTPWWDLPLEERQRLQDEQAAKDRSMLFGKG